MHKFLFYNKFIIFLYTFRALLCSSSGGQNCIMQHLVSSHTVGGRTMCRRVLATIVAVEKQWVLHNMSVCICSLRYPACNAHVPYCHLWHIRLCNIFPHYLSQTIWFSKKKVIEHKMCVLILSTTLPETFFILRRIEPPTECDDTRCCIIQYDLLMKAQ